MASKCYDVTCNCACHSHSDLDWAPPRNPHLIRRTLNRDDFSNATAFDFVEDFQDSNGWLPLKMLNAAKKITMDMNTSIRHKNTRQMINWGLLHFYYNNQDENLSNSEYRLRSNGELSLVGKVVEIYINMYLKPHRAGIAIRKHNQSKSKWKNQDAFDIVKNYITSHVMGVPKHIMRIASRITKDKLDVVKDNDRKQAYLWGALLFYDYGENEDMEHSDYRTSEGKLTLDAKFIRFYCARGNNYIYGHLLN